ncbi:Fasciclin-domain-containing protein [Basidiobolus meristosporus CBS 931.73]|uniref:Fasciclin-domain-containing protein n=1 Tax=Basidiobolus meristosporus CBS 931.73 TaxID=1314790 RepID=A0A1Y1YYW6_9FUNG|nr:Fasciclin-domain-containing protein [Basidiobolus meristosporus CBS 931.73]|eukprot:ORY02897.1 Fasciclin-domain-containing protein [Basidiobolus meristosporus CBS 931.73]
MKWAHLLFSSLLLLTYCQGQDTQKTISDNVSTNEDLSTFSTFLTNATTEEVRSLLASKGPYTLFAPNNAAFSSANINMLDSVAFSNILKYHIIPGTVKTTDLKNTQLLPSLLSDPSLVNLPNGKSQVLPVHTYNNSTIIANASLTKPGLEASNGIMHIIDKILPIPDKPSQLVSTMNTRTFSEILIKTNMAGLIDSMKGVTVFVPVESAFGLFKIDTLNDSALSDMAKLHVASPAVIYSTEFSKSQNLSTLMNQALTFKSENGSTYVNGVEIIHTDMIASNGVIHLISGVLSSQLNLADPPSSNPNQSIPAPTLTGPPIRPSIDLFNAASSTLISFTTPLLFALLACCYLDA